MWNGKTPLFKKNFPSSIAAQLIYQFIHLSPWHVNSTKLKVLVIPLSVYSIKHGLLHLRLVSRTTNPQVLPPLCFYLLIFQIIKFKSINKKMKNQFVNWNENRNTLFNCLYTNLEEKYVIEKYKQIEWGTVAAIWKAQKNDAYTVFGYKSKKCVPRVFVVCSP